jgi:hypothetical protein
MSRWNYRVYTDGYVEVWIRPRKCGNYIDGGRGLIGVGRSRLSALRRARRDLDNLSATLQRRIWELEQKGRR